MNNSYNTNKVVPMLHKTKKAITLAAATLSYDVFTVTGVVEMYVMGVCKTSFTNHGDNVSLGVATLPEMLIANTVASTIDITEMWCDTSLSAVTDTIPTKILVQDSTIILTSTANVTAGVMTGSLRIFQRYWKNDD